MKNRGLKFYKRAIQIKSKLYKKAKEIDRIFHLICLWPNLGRYFQFDMYLEKRMIFNFYQIEKLKDIYFAYIFEVGTKLKMKFKPLF